MKKIIPCLFVIMATLVGTGCMAASQMFAESGIHADWWKGNNGDVGMQTFIPIKVTGVSQDFSIELLGAYVYTTVNPDSGERCALSQLSDTKLNLSYGVHEKLPFDLIFGLGLNLPTGKTDLSNKQLTLVQPPDLFTLPFFGEGFNVDPTIAVAKQWGSWIAGLGVGYTWRGEYDYDADYQKFDPGDMTTVTGEVRKIFSDSLSGKLYTQYISYGKDTVDGDDLHQEGDAKLIGLGMTFTRPSWDITTNLSAIFRGKNKLRNQYDDTFPSEASNSHGDEVNASVVHQYHPNPATAIVSSLRLLYISANDYSSSEAYYIGEREKLTLGLGVQKTCAKGVKAFLGVDGFIMRDKSNWYHPDEDVTYKGASLTGQVSKGF